MATRTKQASAKKGPKKGAKAAPRKRASSRRRAPAPKRSWAWRYRRVLFLVAVVGATAVAGLAYLLARVPVPVPAAASETTLLTDVNGDRLAELHGIENRVPVHLDAVPKVAQDAVLAAEDRHFYRHHGVDPVGVLRATWADLRGNQLQGGSTITQQYVKNTYVGGERSLVRKLREAVLAVKLERKYSKHEILERYLNTVYFGRGAYGIEAGAQAYFGEDVGRLDVAQSAYLAGIIRRPDSGGTDAAVARRNGVLAAMQGMHVITRAQRADASRSPAGVVPRSVASADVSSQAPGAEYFVEYVRQLLLRHYDQRTILSGGLRVQTTLDLRMQAAAFEAVSHTLDRPDDPDAAVVAVDDAGRVVAMVGGRDWTRSKVNLALGAAGGGSGRQGGSAFKPFVLAATLRDGYSMDSSFPGPAQIVLPHADEGRDWDVANFENESYDRVNLVDATAQSVNTAYAQLVLALGPARVVDMAHQLGIRSPLQAVPSIALGTQDVSVLEMADAYSTFARGGYQVDPEVIQKVTTADGTVLEDNHPRRTRVLDRRYADQVTYALRRVVTSGTGTAAAFGKPVAGKTGTTEDYGDAWFVGYTPKLTAAVWMGYSEGQSRPMTDVHGRKVNGGSFPAVIFSKFMDQATRGVDTGSFSEPGPFTGIRLGPPADVVVPSAPAGTTDVSPTTMHALSRPTTTVTVAPPPPRATTTTSPYDGGDPADPGDGGDIRPP